MYLTVLMFAGALWWCLYIVRRLPSDVAELGRLCREWRQSRNAPVSEDLRSEERRKSDLARSARELWSTVALQCCFFWPVTALLLFGVVVPRLVSAARSIIGALNT